MTNTNSHVVVVGAGIIGAAIAWRLAQRDLSVTMVDPQFAAGDQLPARPAWYTAAGMLAPITELDFTETPLLQLNLASLERYGRFAAELSETTGMPTGYIECGTLQVAWDAADLTRLSELVAFREHLGLDSVMLTGRELHRLQPGLAPGLPGGALAESDHQVDPRLLHAALITAARRAGASALPGAAAVDVHDGRAVGVRLDDGSAVPAGTVVLAAGAWSYQVEGVPLGHRPAVRPVKGQVVRLRLPGPPRLDRVLRARIKGSPVYVLPRRDGQYVVGASVEEAGFDQTPRAGAVYELLRDASTLYPEFSEATLDEVCTGLRPGSPDNAPLIGPSGIDNLTVATGHYRNGILLTPVTADAVADLLTTGTLPAPVDQFTPTRLRKDAA